MSDNGNKFKDFTFAIIKSRGDPKTATTLDGHEVTKDEFIYMAPEGFYIQCEDYHGEHFVYKDPEFEKGTPHRWFAMCTCGSPAIILGSDIETFKDALLVCKYYEDNGHHQTSDLKR